VPMARHRTGHGKTSSQFKLGEVMWPPDSDQIASLIQFHFLAAAKAFFVFLGSSWLML